MRIIRMYAESLEREAALAAEESKSESSVKLTHGCDLLIHMCRIGHSEEIKGTPIKLFNTI
jgi:hypothetical protein